MPSAPGSNHYLVGHHLIKSRGLSRSPRIKLHLPFCKVQGAVINVYPMEILVWCYNTAARKQGLNVERYAILSLQSCDFSQVFLLEL